MFEFKMPSMGADMENGILVAWNYEVGAHVNKGDIICEIETAKGDIDVEVWESGTIKEILVQPGTKVPVGEPMALLQLDGVPAEEVPAAAPTPEDRQPKPPVEATTLGPAPPLATPSVPRAAEPAPAQKPPPEAAALVRASPRARRRAAELGVELTAVSGSGPDGAITADDVEHAAEHPHRRVTPVARKMAAQAGVDVDEVTGTGAHEAVTRADIERTVAQREHAEEAPSAPAEVEDRHAALRAAIAAAMARSKREIPHYYLAATVDVSHAMQWLQEQNADRSVADRLVFGALVARAVALAARDVPVMNGLYSDDTFVPSEAVHVGFAVAMRGGGVVAPAVHDVDSLTLDQTMVAIKDVVRRVRNGKLRSSEMTDPTITVTSLGDLGVDTVFGVIYPPQVAIVGVGSVREAAIASEGLVGVHQVVDLTLSGDHRVSDGLAGARFLRRIEENLQHPESL